MKLINSSWFLVFSTIFIVGFLTSQTILKPKFSGVSKFEIIDFSNGKLKANTKLKIKNENWFSYSGKGIQFKMFYKDHLVSEGKNEEVFRFEKKSTSFLDIQTDFYADSLFNDLKTILFHDSILMKVVVSGKFSFLKIQTSRTLEVWINTRQMVDILMSNILASEGLKLEKIKLEKINISNSIFNVGFNFHNNLPFDILLKDIKCDVYSDKTLKNKVSNSSFMVNKIMQKNTIAIVEGDLIVNNVTSFISGISKVLNGSFDYFLNGYALIEVDKREIIIPVNKSFKVNPLTKEVIVIND
jgi:LEA14-like dessication related protein